MMLHMSMSQNTADMLKGYISDPFLKAELRGKCTRVVVTKLKNCRGREEEPKK